MKPTIEELIQNKNNKYVFHGSIKKLSYLEPRQTKDSNGEISNIDDAIFLSSDFFGAIPYSFKEKIKENSKNLDWSFNIPYNNNEIKMTMKNVIIDENLKGYIYVFEKTKDMKNEPLGSTQWKCYHKLIPLYSIKVCYKDYSKYFKVIK